MYPSPPPSSSSSSSFSFLLRRLERSHREEEAKNNVALGKKENLDIFREDGRGQEREIREIFVFGPAIHDTCSWVEVYECTR